MSEVLNKVVVDCSTGISETIPLTPEEIEQMNIEIAESARVFAERQATAEALATLKASAKAKLVAGEPLTAEEADVLVL
jgi:hypothetical protein